MNLTRAKFDELTSDLVERTAIPVQNALKDAGLSASELSKVLLVGGSKMCIRDSYGRKMDNWHQMIYMVQVGLDLKPAITHRFHYTEFEKGFEAMHSLSLIHI